MNIRREFSSLALAVGILMAGGCIFEPYQENARFDLVVPVAEPVPGGPVTVAEFRNESSAGSRIQFRDASSGLVTADPYNSWVLPPGELTARALTLALNSGSESGVDRVVYGSLEVFEVTLPERRFQLAGKFSCDGQKTFHRFHYEEPVNGPGADAVAAAASAAMGKLAEKIAGTGLRSSEK